MARTNGTLIILDADGDAIAQVIDCTLNINRDTPDANDKDNAPWSNHLDETGVMDWDIDVNGNADWVDATGNVAKLTDFLINRSSVAIIFGPEAVGSTSFTGNASTNSITLGAPYEDTAPISGTFVGQGALTPIPVS
jgi:hypothetical protein